MSQDGVESDSGTGVTDGKEDGQPLYVLWWAPMHLRYWSDEEIVYTNGQGKFFTGEEDYREVARFHAIASRYGGKHGGRVRRNPNTGEAEVQIQVPFGRRERPVILVCDTSSP